MKVMTFESGFALAVIVSIGCLLIVVEGSEDRPNISAPEVSANNYQDHAYWPNSNERSFKDLYYETYHGLEPAKRAPSAGFYGMRGKKVPGNNFYGMRGKKGPSGFLGMRGKKEDFAGRPVVYEDFDGEGEEGWWPEHADQKRIPGDGFMGLRGKRSLH